MDFDIDHCIDRHRAKVCQLADRIWGYAELKFDEHASSQGHADCLQAEGFRVTRGVAGLPTALLAEYGSGAPVVALLGEYDALPGMSQVAGENEPNALQPDAGGHGCGHHLLGGGSLLAALALKNAIEAGAVSGTLRYYGCPAEEGGSGKTFMVREGLFDDVDVALTWHPDSFNGVSTFDNLANLQACFRFEGRASHAAIAPHLGRSALDAVELMNVGSNYLREHMPPQARVHYAITDSGGRAPGVVQARAEVLYLLRSGQMNDVLALFERVKKIAEGAALMTETAMSWQFDRAASSVLGNRALETLLQTCLERVGGAQVDEQDLAEAVAFRRTFTAQAIESGFTDLGLMPDDSALHAGVVPLAEQRQLIYASSDVGDVSRVVPTGQVYMACYAIGTGFHSWQMVAQGKAAFAHKGMVQAAKVLAYAAYELFMHPSKLLAIKEEFTTASTRDPYRNPIPKDVTPAIQ